MLLQVFNGRRMGMWIVIEEGGRRENTVETTMRWFPLSTTSNSERERDRENNTTRASVYLNVYDLTPINNYLYMLGLGIFHSGIQGLWLFSLYFLSCSFFLSLYGSCFCSFSCLCLLQNLAGLKVTYHLWMRESLQFTVY